MKPFDFHPEARVEFAEAALYYAAINRELGDRFYDEIKRLIADACRTPATFRLIRKPARRHFTREFPYGVIYVERPRRHLDSRRYASPPRPRLLGAPPDLTAGAKQKRPGCEG